MGLAARQLVSESYTIEATNAALLNVYESVMAGRRKPEQRASGAVRR
jgi:hypothetical protein